MSKIDQITLFRINSLHPIIRKEVKKIYLNEILRILPDNITCRFTHTLRTFSEQEELYAQGRTKPGKKVTNARAGQSMHNYGLAIDIVILVDKNGDGKFETVSWNIDNNWMSIVNIFKEHGYIWGGDWTKFKDYPHFEKTFGNTWQNLKAIYDNKIFDEEGYIKL